LTAIETRADDLAQTGDWPAALAGLEPALSSRIPNSELWLKAARLYDLNQRFRDSEEAFAFAEHLGVGRLDAEVLRLSRRAYRDPEGVAREFARRLQFQPEDRAARLGLVQALLHARDVAAAERALSPLVEETPSHPEVVALAAQVRAAKGRIRQARSLHESLIRQDPLAADPRAAHRALDEANEMGASVGYEYGLRNDTTGSGVDLDAWQEGFLSAFWRIPYAQTVAATYRWYERESDLDHQLWLEWSRGLGRSWVVRASVVPGIDADYVARWRFGLGASGRVRENLFAGLDGYYLNFTDVEVWQLAPVLTWRWHPRGTLEGRVYLADNRLLDSGQSKASVTWGLNASWQLADQSLLTLRAAVGDENSANPTRDLIANDDFQSYGIDFRLGWRHRWWVQPVYRYEVYEKFDLHAIGLSVAYNY
jgi:YaiO family outer membrane protein